MEKGWLRVMVRYPLVVLVEERRLALAALTAGGWYARRRWGR